MGDVIARAMSAVRLELQHYKDAAELARLERDEAREEARRVRVDGAVDAAEFLSKLREEDGAKTSPLTVEQVREALRSGAEVELVDGGLLRGKEGGCQCSGPHTHWHDVVPVSLASVDAANGHCIRIHPVGPVTKERAILHMELGGEVSLTYSEHSFRRIVDGRMETSYDGKRYWHPSPKENMSDATNFYTLIPFTSVGF